MQDLVPTNDLADEIERLHKLMERGILTEEEFKRAKEKALRPEGLRRERDKTTYKSKSSTTTSSYGSRKSNYGSTTTSSRRRSKRSSRSRSSSSSSGRGFIVPQRTDVWRVTKQGLQQDDSNSPNDIFSGSVSPAAASHHIVPPQNHSFVAGHGDDVDDDSAPFISSHPTEADSRTPPECDINATPAAKQRRRARASFGPNEKRPAYGTFGEHPQQRDLRHHAKVRHNLGVRLLPRDKVVCQYFNSRGASSSRYEDVKFQSEYDDGLRVNDPLYKEMIQQHREESINKGGASVSGSTTVSMEMFSPSRKGATGGGGMSDLVSMSKSSRTSRSSDELVLSFDWLWVDLVGRDESNNRQSYNRHIAKITEQFSLCPSLLVDREHTLVLPQFVEAASNPHQYLVVLRVATPKINLTADSAVELTNRWIIVVDLEQKLIITLHRWDTVSIAQLRAQWKHLMQQSIAFEEFLLKILDDASSTFSSSVDVHQGLLDECESKLLMTSSKRQWRTSKTFIHKKVEKEMATQIMSLFEDGETNKFLQQLIHNDKGSFDREEMNQFLYHLHRRSSVQYRMLTITQPVLLKCFTKFRLCSRDRSSQLCGYCNDLAAKALEVRDNAKHLLDMHISLVSFHTNELMALLTRFSIYFIPLEFLAAVYGMNFVNMPELEWKYGYRAFWVLGLFVVAVLYFSFKRRF